MFGFHPLASPAVTETQYNHYYGHSAVCKPHSDWSSQNGCFLHGALHSLVVQTRNDDYDAHCNVTEECQMFISLWMLFNHWWLVGKISEWLPLSTRLGLSQGHALLDACQSAAKLEALCTISIFFSIRQSWNCCYPSKIGVILQSSSELYHNIIIIIMWSIWHVDRHLELGWKLFYLDTDHSPFAAFCEFGLYKWHYYYYHHILFYQNYCGDVQMTLVTRWHMKLLTCINAKWTKLFFGKEAILI